jgi:hypothetical protein
MKRLAAIFILIAVGGCSNAAQQLAQSEKTDWNILSVKLTSYVTADTTLSAADKGTIDTASADLTNLINTAASGSTALPPSTTQP